MPGVGDTLGCPLECPYTGRHPGLLFRGSSSVHLGHRDPGSRTELHNDWDLCRAVRHGGEKKDFWPLPSQGAAESEENHRWALGGGVLWAAHFPQEYLEDITAHHSCRELLAGSLLAPVSLFLRRWDGDGAHPLHPVGAPRSVSLIN